MREKARTDPDFQERLLHFILDVAQETMPPYPPQSTAEELRPGSRCFQPLLDPDHPYFDEQMQIDMHDIVTRKNMHSQNHTPTCFKYGRLRCRARFPRKLHATTFCEPETGIVVLQRDNQWLNNFNKWFSIMTHANHDCQFLSTKDHAISVIYYILKYISKPEAAYHTKLTIVAAVRNAMKNNPTVSLDSGKSFLVKAYNKLDTQREVGVPEAISHLLDIPDHYTDALFKPLHSSHALWYAKKLASQTGDNETGVTLDANLITNGHGYSMVSHCDDYAYRGDLLSPLTLFDYTSLVYKESAKEGQIRFDPGHPQFHTKKQNIRIGPPCVPTILGRLLFVTQYATDPVKVEDYFCLLSVLFVPWSHNAPHKPCQGQTWQEYYISKSSSISARLLSYIDNLDLLHKSKQESDIDAMLQCARSDEQVSIPTHHNLTLGIVQQVLGRGRSRRLRGDRFYATGFNCR